MNECYTCPAVQSINNFICNKCRKERKHTQINDTTIQIKRPSITYFQSAICKRPLSVSSSFITLLLWPLGQNLSTIIMSVCLSVVCTFQPVLHILLSYQARFAQLISVCVAEYSAGVVIDHSMSTVYAVSYTHLTLPTNREV